MHVNRRSDNQGQPMRKAKNATSPSFGGTNQAKPIKNAVASRAKAQGYECPKNTVAHVNDKSGGYGSSSY